MQDAVAALLGETVGWKVGATSAAAQAFLAVDAPIRGHVIASGLMSSGRDIVLPGMRDAEAEPEILFRLAHDPAGLADPADAIGAIHLGLEINRPSYRDPFAHGVTAIVADNAAHAALVIGPEIPHAALDDPAAIRAVLRRNDDIVGGGDAGMVLGNPRNALRWLARHLAPRRRPLRGGDWIASGAICRAATLSAGDAIIADFGVLGTVAVRRCP